MSPEQGSRLAPFVGFADTRRCGGRHAMNDGIRFQIDQEAIRNMFADRMQIVSHVVDEGDRQRALRMQRPHDRPFRLQRRKQGIGEVEPVEKTPPLSPELRRHGREENDIGIPGEIAKRIDNPIEWRLPLFLCLEESVDQPMDVLLLQRRPIELGNDIAGQPEGSGQEFMALAIEEGQERRKEMQYDVIDIADDQRPILETDMRCIEFERSIHRQYSPEARPGGEKCADAAATASGGMPRASQKASNVGSWFIRKSSMPARKAGSLIALRTCAGSTPVSARKRPNISGSLASQPSTAIAVSCGSAAFFFGFLKLLCILKGDLPIFQPNPGSVRFKYLWNRFLATLYFERMDAIPDAGTALHA
ncbi:hypothetical protein RHSP_16448 [Rhizobium freirei PRF 81]|uniref:Uncharacterized protein n=1 Tax=Rhizobium freirei PRF 81 TaxID=363754 RepID=N6UYY7_9HYPH|nr:hypothetical protein RHSP_16448 [Rhizobium freirei PRF 81]